MIERTGGRRTGIARALSATVLLTLVVTNCSSDSDSVSTTLAPAPGLTTDSNAAVDPSTPVDPNATTTPSVVTGSSAADSAVVEPTSTTVVETTTTTIPPTTTTIIPLVTDGALVLVANAAGLPGAAGQVTAALQAVGFAMKEPTDAAGYEESLDASKIYFRPEAEAAAQSLAAVLQINSVTRMPTPAPIVDAMVGLGDATVLIMLGKDLAGKDLPGLAGR